MRLFRLVGIPRRLALTLDRLGAFHALAGDAGAAAEARLEARRLVAGMDPAGAHAVTRRFDQLAET